jgi:hypothetical protein
MRVLDIDLDFFVQPIANWPRAGRRLPRSEYSVWTPDQVHRFLEEQCGLSRERPCKGWVFRHHDEALYYWLDLIDEGVLEAPFDLVHVDAHSDLGSKGYGGERYIMGELLAKPLADRRKPDLNKVRPSNFLAFAIANRLVRTLTFVMPEAYTNDMYWFYWANPENAYDGLQLKLYSETSLGRVMQGVTSEVPLEREPVVPFMPTPLTEFVRGDEFAIATLCQSPEYTTEEADAIIAVFREYIRP